MKEDIPPSYISRLSTFKQKLSESLGDVYYFYQPTNRDIHERQMLMIPTKRLHEMIQTALDAAPPSSQVDNIAYESNIMTIVHAGLICRKQLTEHPGHVGLNVSKELARSVVPELLHLWLCVVSKGQDAVDDFFNDKEKELTEVEDYYDVIESDDSDDDTDFEDEEETSDGRVIESNCL